MPGDHEQVPDSHQSYIDAIEGDPYVSALRRLHSGGGDIRTAAHVALDLALDRMQIPKDEQPEAESIPSSAPEGKLSHQSTSTNVGGSGMAPTRTQSTESDLRGRGGGGGGGGGH
ncbi:MAG TPA: hypothetical protein VGF75_05350 [Candidatus Saccharimonadales bacterium]|jgi:hypothetical protein